MDTFYEIKCYSNERCILSYSFKGNLKKYTETVCDIQRKYDEYNNFDNAIVTVNADTVDKYSFVINF